MLYALVKHGWAESREDAEKFLKTFEEWFGKPTKTSRP